VGIPKLASFILTHDWEGEIKGLNDFGENHPPVSAVFWSFRIMVGMGILMLLFSWVGAFQLKRKQELSPFMARGFVLMTFSGWVATLAGWYVTEIGRQPWLVQNVLKTEAAVAAVPAPFVNASLAAYLSVYALILASYIATLFYMAHQAAKEPLKGQKPGKRRVLLSVFTKKA
jgi:cytochrome bd ubiquinol oxidase subunit I